MRLPRRRPRAIERAAGARVARDAVLVAGADGARIVLGSEAVVGARSLLRAAPGATIRVDGEIGEDCRLAAQVAIVVAAGARLGDRCALIDFDHVADDAERPIRQQGLRSAPVTVEAGALLGPGVTVLRGVTVGARATVLANSVVTRDIPADARAQGAPARIAATELGPDASP